MTEPDDRTRPVRDVPPPRPVSDASTPDDGGLGRAARAVADAVAGLLGSGPEAGGARPGRGAAAGILRDVVGAVASAARSGREAPGPGSPAAGAGPEPKAARDRGPTAVLGDLLAAAGPRLPIRDAERLGRAYPGFSREEIADVLVARAGRLTAAIGAATGGLTAAQWFAPPSLLALPLELGAETLLTAAVEVVLLGELHELYGRPAGGDAGQRAAAYLASWSHQRADDGSAAALAGVLGAAGLRTLRRRLGRRLTRALPSAAPFLLGAAVAGRGNRRATESLADRVRADLRRGLRRGSAR